MRRLLSATLLITLCAAPSAQPVEGEWQAITLYPPTGVYHADFLPAMVAAVEGLWQLQDTQGQPLLKTIDSIASMNVIIAQDDEVRFRRIIEVQELDDTGLQRMRQLVETHPLAKRRLVTQDGHATHLWLRMQQSADSITLSRFTTQLQHSLQHSLNVECRSSDALQGPMANRYFTQWQFNATGHPQSLQALQALAQAQAQLQKRMTPYDNGQYYSALDLLTYLGRILGPELISSDGLPISEMAVAQIYMLAESLRSRDLGSLARPDFRQLQLIMLGHNEPIAAPTVPGYQLNKTSEWHGNSQHYRVLDCRPLVTASMES